MAIRIKTNDMEIYCEKFNYNNGYLNVDDFVGVEKQNIGKGLYAKINSTIEINNTDTSFYEIKKEAWENIKNNFKPINTQLNDDIYKNEGMAIFIKGKMVIGIYPDNLENNLMHLANGNMSFDWGVIAKNSGIKIE